jgi:endonuclease YncB( thermonuclease family)
MAGLLLLAFLLVALPAADYAWPMTGVVDGDTLKVRIPSLPAELQALSARVRGIDAPEAGSHARCELEQDRAARATARLKALALGSGTVTFRDPAWDKYGGRVDATVLINREDLAPTIIQAGLARPYSGGRRQPWCR